jgi:hypothetical protein
VDKEHVRSEILRLRKRNTAPTEQEINERVKAFRATYQARMDAEVAEYEAGLRSPSYGLSFAEQGELVGRMAELATRLYLDGGPDVETYIKSGDEVEAVDVQDHPGA